eukprot:s5955_g4.t1
MWRPVVPAASGGSEHGGVRRRAANPAGLDGCRHKRLRKGKGPPEKNYRLRGLVTVMRPRQRAKKALLAARQNQQQTVTLAQLVALQGVRQQKAAQVLAARPKALRILSVPVPARSTRSGVHIASKWPAKDLAQQVSHPRSTPPPSA